LESEQRQIHFTAWRRCTHCCTSPRMRLLSTKCKSSATAQTFRFGKAFDIFGIGTPDDEGRMESGAETRPKRSTLARFRRVGSTLSSTFEPVVRSVYSSASISSLHRHSLRRAIRTAVYRFHALDCPRLRKHFILRTPGGPLLGTFDMASPLRNGMKAKSSSKCARSVPFLPFSFTWALRWALQGPWIIRNSDSGHALEAKKLSYTTSSQVFSEEFRKIPHPASIVVSDENDAQAKVLDN